MCNSALEDQRRLIDVEAVGKILGVSARTVRRLADLGRLPPPIRLGGSVRWDRAAIYAWIAEGCQRIGRSD